MQKRNRSRSMGCPATVEALEPRELWSASTTTTMTPSTKSLVFGQTLDVLVKVRATKGTLAPRGYVRLYLNKNPSVWKATLNSKGTAHILIDPGLTIFAGSYSLTVHYVPTGNFTASVSKKAPLSVAFPKKISKKADGLGIKTITAGKGAAVVKGESISVEETAYDTSGVVDGNSLKRPGSIFTFTVQANPAQVIAGFDEGVVGMRVGEVRDLQIPAALNATDGRDLFFVVKLVSINK